MPEHFGLLSSPRWPYIQNEKEAQKLAFSNDRYLNTLIDKWLIDLRGNGNGNGNGIRNGFNIKLKCILSSLQCRINGGHETKILSKNPSRIYFPERS